MCFLFHEWTKWLQYDVQGVDRGFAFKPHEPIPFSERRQKRTCTACGKEQDERVREL